MLLRFYTLLLAIVFAGASWATFGPFGGAFLFIVVGLLIVYVRYSATWPGLVHVAFILFFLYALACLFLPALGNVREVTRRMQCANNFKQCGLALHKYAETNGCFPPPCILDKSGRPMHSWRILILPFMKCQDLYSRYDFTELWNGPKNKKLLTYVPVYACPCDKTTWNKNSTNYLAVVGKGSGWQRDKCVSPKDAGFKQLADSTVLVIESVDSGVNWMEPKDFSIDDLDNLAPTAIVETIQIPHIIDDGYFFHVPRGGYINMCLADGSVRPVHAEALRAENLRKLLQVGGFTEENVEAIGKDKLEPRLNWPHCIGLPLWFVSVGLLLVQAVRGRKRAKETQINPVPA